MQSTTNISSAAGIALAAAAFAATPASAQVMTYFGIDPSASTTTSPRPNSNAAAADFDAALGDGVTGIIDFEGLPLGAGAPDMSPATVAPGVTVSQVNTSISGGVLSGSSGILGFNTTLGGSQFLRHQPQSGDSTSRFEFDTPIDSWGAYITGLGTASGDLFIEYDDGSTQSFPVTGNDSGGTLFFGFTGADSPVVAVEASLLNVSGSFDFFGIDDVRYGSIPEPAAAGLLAVAAAAGLLRRRRGA